MPNLEFVDAHCHLNLFAEPHKTISESRSKGVGVIVTAGGSGKDNIETLKLLEHERVFAVVGIGPDFAAKDSGLVGEIEALVKMSRKIVGIGEIGVDTKVAADNDLGLQKEIFRKQVQIAKELDLPIVIHSRGALDEVIKIIESEHMKRAMFHFFEGDEKQASELAKKGYLISIPPAWTGKRKRIIKEVGLNSLVAETDSPIVGKTPADVVGVCEAIAKLKGVSLEEVATETTENIRRLFYI
jgi:TatD DNase family protein